MKHNIILIGFMGCGKSSIGVRLSYKLRMAMVDTDKLIESRAGKSISDIFASEGEACFRERERQCLEGLLSGKSRRILSTGGGLPLRAENRAMLKELGQVIYLRATPQTIYERLKSDTTRPLLQTENPKQRIEELLLQRASIYEEAADVVIDVDGREFEEIIHEIRSRYHRWERKTEKGKQKKGGRKNAHTGN